jgi:general secretion pathway protein H
MQLEESERMRNTSERGFTLIEIMIVMAIIAAVLAIGGPRLFDAKNEMRRAVRELAILPRELRDNSRLFGLTTRLVITMDEEKTHTISVESASGSALLLSEEQENELAKLTEMQRADVAQKDSFHPETRILKKPKNLPRGLFISAVEYATRSKAVVNGKAYIHFFPQGLAEEAAIHLTDKKSLNWTIVIEPLTGRAQVFERNVALKELNQP